MVSSRVAKNRRTSDLSVEKTEMVTLRTGPALEQAERWVDQWDSLQTRSSNGHLRVSTPTSSSTGKCVKWKQGVCATIDYSEPMDTQSGEKLNGSG